MKELPIAWLQEDEMENIRRYDLGFNRAEEAVLNQASLVIPNTVGDAAYVGLTDDLKDVLYVYCAKNEGFRQILFARRASEAKRTYFLIIYRIKYENQKS